MYTKNCCSSKLPSQCSLSFSLLVQCAVYYSYETSDTSNV
uniref:Uncharacterized protein n=1 Tax=Anguilla anguilla TaxID=7936 RepID=A0A0E9URS6_ANGAN